MGRPQGARVAQTDAQVQTAEPLQLTIAPMTGGDWPAVARIYAAGIAGGDATFEHVVPSWDEWSAARLSEPRLVARALGGGAAEQLSAQPTEVLGWAALSPASSRAVYRGVAEVSVYVDPAFGGRGIGSALLQALIEQSERAGFWTLEAGIFPENTASISLHERCGFELLGTRRRVGQMSDGRWRDVALYERRSRVVGGG